MNFEELMTAAEYKEIHRAKMITWGEDKRQSDPYFFCNKTVENANAGKPVWIISDARRKSDVQFFREHFPSVSRFVRIAASVEIRESRGFVFCEGKNVHVLSTGLTIDISGHLEYNVLLNLQNHCKIYDIK